MAVYVLRLEGGKYYVGYTERENVMDRVWEHVWQMETGAEWTKLHGVRELVDMFEDATLETERQVTLDCMRQYGWQNVRGSVYCSPNLKEPPVELGLAATTQQALKQQHSKTLVLQNCHNCNQPGHFAADCPSTFCRLCNQKGHIAVDCTNKKQIVCYQCGEKGHLKSDCTINERRCFTCKQPGHFSSSCPAQTEKGERRGVVNLSKTYGACYKCGQTGHWAKFCPTTTR
jgi:hypothetical protein